MLDIKNISKNLAVVLLFLCILDNSLYMFGALCALYSDTKNLRAISMPLIGFLFASLVLLFFMPAYMINFKNYSIGIILQGIISLAIRPEIKNNNIIFIKNFGWMVVLILNLCDLSNAHDFDILVKATTNLTTNLVISSLGYTFFSNPIVHLKSSLDILTATTILYIAIIYLIRKLQKHLELRRDQTINKEISLVLLLDGSLKIITGIIFILNS